MGWIHIKCGGMKAIRHHLQTPANGQGSTRRTFMAGIVGARLLSSQDRHGGRIGRPADITSPYRAGADRSRARTHNHDRHVQRNCARPADPHEGRGPRVRRHHESHRRSGVRSLARIRNTAGTGWHGGRGQSGWFPQAAISSTKSRPYKPVPATCIPMPWR